MNRRRIFIVCLVVIIIGAAAVWIFRQGKPDAAPGAANSPSPSATASAPAPAIAEPISHARDRVTKKPLGIFVKPGASPVQPERFTGYHTGVDFETTEAEQNADVPVYALCDGPLVQKRTASGYGGVIVQGCVLNNQDVTVIYGHIRLVSVSAAVGDQLAHGQQIAVLGTGYSSETDGERKHLHLGIHVGTAITIAGYVQTKDELNGWLNVLDYLP